MSDKFLPPPFRIDVAHDGDETRLRPVGELDIGTAPQLEAALLDASRPGRRVIVDLRGLDFMDSTGLTLLTRWALAANADSFSLALVQGNERIRRLFELTRLVAHFQFVSG